MSPRATRTNDSERRLPGAGTRTLLLAALLLALIACSSAPPAAETPTSADATMPSVTETDDGRSADAYLRRAAGDDETGHRLHAAELAIAADNADAAALLLGALNPSALALEQQARYSLALASIALLRQRPDQAIQALLDGLFEDQRLATSLQLQRLTLQAESYHAANRHLAAARALSRRAPLLSAQERVANNNMIWQILSSAPADTLSARDLLVDSYELRGWLELLDISNRQQDPLEDQIAAIERWRERWNQHSAAAQLPDSLAFMADLRNNRPRHIALLLPLQTAAGQAVSQGFMSAYYEALSQGGDTPEITVYDTSNNTDIIRLYRRAAESGADLVVGPMDKDTVRALQNQRNLPVPTLALNYGDEDRLAPEGLFQFGLAPEDEIRQTALMAWQAGHRHAAVLMPASADHDRLQQYFVNYWQTLGGEVVTRASYGSASGYSDVVRRLFHIDDSETRANQLRELLPRNNFSFTPRRRQDIDFLFLVANPADGRQLRPTLSFHYAGDVPVYALPSIYDGGRSPAENRDLDGIIFSDAPWILRDDDALRAIVSDAWNPASGAVERLRAMGVDSFRLIYRLAQLANFPGVRIQGVTGILSLADDGSIRRQLPAAHIVNGRAESLPERGDEVEAGGIALLP